MLRKIINGVITAAVVAIIGITFFVLLGEMKVQMKDYSQEMCGEMDGILMNYECDELFERCEGKKLGFYCLLANGTEIDVNVKEIIN